jgi:chromosome segregation ATPase
MTTAGKVFSVLSFLMGLAFLFFVTPVVKQLIDVQKQIVAIEAQHPPLRQAAAELETERLKLVYDLNRIKGKVAAELTKNQNQADAVRSQLSLLTDLEKAERQAVVNWQKTVADLKREIESRQQEQADLQQAIASNSAERDTQAIRVSQLRDESKNAQAKLRETLETMASEYDKLEKNLPQNSTDNRVALER